MATPGRIQEAEKHLSEARKCLKTGLLKWSPDYGGAASSFDKAAICFRNSRDHARAKDTYIKAAEAHYNSHAIFHAGKSYEQAANVTRDNKDLEEAARLYQRASEYYNESGHPDTAGQILLKAAQLLQHENPGLAAKYFLATADYNELDEKYREAANSIKNAVRMYCRMRPRQYDKIAETARLSRTAFLRAGAINMAHEAISVEIIAMLMKGQALDSLDVLQEADVVPEFSKSEERSMLEQMIDAMNQEDHDTVAECCDSGVFRSMDPEFAKFARDLKLGEDSEEPTRQPKREVTATKEPTKVNDKDTKKNPTQLADMRNQLFTKSTGEKVSSKMPKPRSAYKSTPVEDKQDPPPGDSPVTSGRGLEEEPPVSHEEPPVSTPEEPKEEIKDDQIPETDVVKEEEGEGEGDKMVAEGDQDDDEDEPLDIN